MSSVSDLELKCREAFQREAGYGDIGLNPALYRTFRDGFYAAYGVFVVAPMCKNNQEPKV